MGRLAQEYLRQTIEILQTITTSQAAQIDLAASWLAEAIGSGHRVFITQTSHSLDSEATKRAGGFVAVHPLVAAIYLNQPVDPVNLAEELRKGDLFPERGDIAIVGTNAGVDSGTVGIALACKHLGCKIIALTQVAFEQSSHVTAVFPADKKLHEIADVVIDLGGEVGDGLLPLPGLNYKICPTSGVIGMAVMWAIFAGAAEKLVASGKLPLIYKSVDLEGGSAMCEKLVAEYEHTRVGYRLLDR